MVERFSGLARSEPQATLEAVVEDERQSQGRKSPARRPLRIVSRYIQSVTGRKGAVLMRELPMSDRKTFDDHFLQPRNAGVLEGADLKVRAENPVCGDLMDLYLRRGEDGRVE